MPVVDFRELTVAADPSSKVNFTKTATSGAGTLTVATSSATKVDLTKAAGSSFGSQHTPALTLVVNGSSKLNFTRTNGSRFGTLALVADGSVKFSIAAGPRRMGPTSIAGIPVTGQIWPRANAGV